jgi:DNA-binding HxlR family transcriptional regulator
MTVQTALEPRLGCIAAALRVIGQKWTALLIRDLCEGPKRFGELERSVEGINPRTLSQRLQALEHYGIITKKTYAEVPPRTEYTLTEKGKDIIPILRQMAAWGDKYQEKC